MLECLREQALNLSVHTPPCMYLRVVASRDKKYLASGFASAAMICLRAHVRSACSFVHDGSVQSVGNALVRDCCVMFLRRCRQVPRSLAVSLACELMVEHQRRTERRRLDAALRHVLI